LWSDDLAELDAPWLQHVASFAAGVRHATFPATAQEHHLRRLLAAPGGVPEVVSDSAFHRGRDLLRARRTSAFTEYDGNLAGVAVPSPADGTTLVSPTRLERWATCPLRYFFTDVLRVGEVENPEAVLRISALDRGGLLHAALDRFVAEVLRRPPTEQPGPDDPWTDADAERLIAIFDEEAAKYVARGLTGRDLFWRQDRRSAHRDLREMLRHDTIARREERTRPIATELAFGFDAEAPPVAVDVPGAGPVRFRGVIDRVDRRDDGALLVTDYKTGRPDGYAGLGETEPTVGGTRLQLPVYALAARQALGDTDTDVTAEYWFATVAGHFVHRALPLTDDVHDTVVADLATIVGGIEAGRFPAHPGWQRWIDCPVCDPDGAGTAERWREWSRKKDAPELDGYRALAARQGADRG
jgi:hypothetical protein